MGRNKIRLQTQGLLIAADRFVELAQIFQDVPEVVVGSDARRLANLQGLTAVGDRLVELTLVVQDNPQVVVRASAQARFVTYGLAIVSDCLIQPARASQGNSWIIVSIGIVGLRTAEPAGSWRSYWGSKVPLFSQGNPQVAVRPRRNQKLQSA